MIQLNSIYYPALIPLLLFYAAVLVKLSYCTQYYAHAVLKIQCAYELGCGAIISYSYTYLLHTCIHTCVMLCFSYSSLFDD